MTLIAETTSSASGQPDQTRLWYTRCGVPTAFGLALQTGLFGEEFGVDRGATLTPIQAHPDPVVHASHFTHAQENSFRHGSIYPAAWAQGHGANTRILGISFLRGAQTLLTVPDSGIETAKNLKGKRLLALRRPQEPYDYSYINTLRLYEVALKSAGLTLDDVTLVERSIERSFVEDRRTPELEQPGVAAWRKRSRGRGNDSLFPLIRGEVDVITSGGGIGASSLQIERTLGLQAVFDLDSITDEVERANNSSVILLAVKADLLERRPDLVDRLLQRVLEAEEFARTDPAGTVRAIAREQFQPEQLVAESFGNNLASSLHLDFDVVKVAAVKSQIRYLAERKFIPHEFDVEAWLAREPLAKLRGQWNSERSVA